MVRLFDTSHAGYQPLSQPGLKLRTDDRSRKHVVVSSVEKDPPQADVDEVLLSDLGRPLVETIVQYKNNTDARPQEIAAAFRSTPEMVTKRSDIGHPSAAARIPLQNGDVFMALVNDLKKKKLHVKLYDPSTCPHLPFAGQMLRKADLRELIPIVQSMCETFHSNSGARSGEYYGRDTVHLMEETHVYADLPE